MSETPAQKATRLLAKARLDVNQGENALGRVLYALGRGNAPKAQLDANIAENEMGQSLYALTQLDAAVQELIKLAGDTAPDPTPEPQPTPTPVPTPTPTPTPVPVPPGALRPKGNRDWKVLQIGAGGYITGIDAAADGTLVIRTDTYGGYLWDGQRWQQLFTRATMPDDVDLTGLPYEIRIAPSNTNIFYAHLSNGFFRTDDRGRNWTRLPFPIAGSHSGDRRADGQKMAVHPTDPNVVLAGTEGKGTFITRDGGKTWTKIDAIPVGEGNDRSVTGICIRGNRMLAGSFGAGVFESTDGGRTWKNIGGPAAIGHATLTPADSYVASDFRTGALWRYAGGQWSKPLPDGNSIHAVAADPKQPGRMACTNNGGAPHFSRDDGKTWTGQNHATKAAISDDIPYLNKTGDYLSSGGIVFDPKGTDRLLHSAGVGVWELDIPADPIEWWTPLLMRSRSLGIEQLVTTCAVAPKGGKPSVACWDRAMFYIDDPDRLASTYTPEGFTMCWSVASAAHEPLFLVRLVAWWGADNNHHGFSTDGGKTWQRFASLPANLNNAVGGCIAASTRDNFIMLPSGRLPSYTLDGGKTWAECQIPGATDPRGFHHSYYLRRFTVAADPVRKGVFRIYYTGEAAGVYETRDGGKTWEKVFSGQPADWAYWNSQLLAVPGRADDLLFNSGAQTGPKGEITAITLRRSRDGGRTWAEMPEVQAVSVGFGAPLVAGGPAAIYLWGFIDGKRAIYGSADDGKTWVPLGDYPLESLDSINFVEGDMNIPGRVYVGFGGSGCAYLDAAQ